MGEDLTLSSVYGDVSRFVDISAGALDGELVPLHTYFPPEPGSSVSHLDEYDYRTYGMMMTPYADYGNGARMFSDVELGILKDLGYTQIANIPAIVPLPGAFPLMLGGLGVLGELGIRRRLHNR